MTTNNPKMMAGPVPGADAKNYIAADGTLMLYGIIGDWWDDLDAASVINQVMSASDDTIKVRIHSQGGSVVDGLAIYNALKNCGKPVEVTIDCLAASIATVVALAGTTRRMPKNAYQFVHQAWDYAEGNADDLRKHAETLDMWTNEVAGIYAEHSNISEDEWKALMASDTWLNSDTCLEYGLATEILGEVTAVAHHNFDIKNNAPDPVKALMQLPITAAASAANPKEEPDMPRMNQNAGGESTPAAGGQPAAVPGADAQAAIKAERARIADLRGIAAKAKLPEDKLNGWIDQGTDVATARAEAFEHLANQDRQTVPRGRVTVSNGDNGQMKKDMTAALMHRASSANSLESGNQFAHMSLPEMARMSLEYQGISTAGMTKSQIATAALHSTSDLPEVFSNLANNELARGYGVRPRTFTAFARLRNLPDFKSHQITRMSDAPELQDKLETGEYEVGYLQDSKETMALSTKGRMIKITRNMIINDTLGALTELPYRMGAKAAAMENRLVYALITSNPTMKEDNKALFHAGHNNLGTAGAPSVDLIGEMRKLLRTQKTFAAKGEEGEVLNTPINGLLVPAALETAADKLVTSIQSAKSDDVNPFQNLSVIAEAELDANSTTAWYGFGDPALVDGVIYGYLEGEEGIFIDSMADFDTDGMKMKVCHDFHASMGDYRGWVKNPGAS